MIAVGRQRSVRFSTAADWLGALSADRQALREEKKIRRGLPPAGRRTGFFVRLLGPDAGK